MQVIKYTHTRFPPSYFWEKCGNEATHWINRKLQFACGMQQSIGWIQEVGCLCNNTWVLTLLTLMFALFHRNTHAMLINTPALINSKKLLVSCSLQMIQTIQICLKVFFTIDRCSPISPDNSSSNQKGRVLLHHASLWNTECPFVCRHAVKSCWMEKFNSW